jgi:hypothetical protein
MKMNLRTMLRPGNHSLWSGFAIALQALSLPESTGAAVAYRETFALDGGGYTASPGSSWAWDTPTSGPLQAHSGAKVWATNPGGDYGTNEEGYLTSPPIDLSGYNIHEFFLSWWQYLVTEPGFDFARVEVSPNGGGTWATVYGESSGRVSTNWTKQTVALGSEYAVSNFRLRFRLRSDDTVNAPGFYVDDLEITAEITQEVYREDFEASNGGFSVDAGSSLSSWEWGVPVYSPPGAPPGSHVWGTALSGFYGPNEDGTLTSPPLNLSRPLPPYRQWLLTWWQCLQTEAGSDFASVQVSRDGGASWATVYGEVSGTVSASWMKQHVNLAPDYAVTNFMVRFRLTSDDSVHGYGFRVDQIRLAAVLDGPAFAPPTRPATGTIQINLAGENEATYEILASTNFLDWVPLVTVTSPSGLIHWIDPSGANLAQRFYRAKVLQRAPGRPD